MTSRPTPTQAEVDAVRRGEPVVISPDGSEREPHVEDKAMQAVASTSQAGYETRQAEAMQAVPGEPLPGLRRPEPPSPSRAPAEGKKEEPK